MYTYDDICHVHLEPTTRCNARCPMCARNACGRTAPGLDLVEMDLDTVRTVFETPLLARLAGFDLCGAYGDPAVTSDLIDIVRYVRASSPRCTITVFTNGGVRSPRFWQQLAGALGEPARVVFAIDGLAETNGVYRRGVVFERVVENARAFIGAGGVAQWDFIAFRHNEHEIDAARRTSEELGFRSFSLKKTARFLKPAYDYVPEYEQHDDLSRFPIYSADGRIAGHLEPPRASSLVNGTARRYEALLDREDSLEAVLSATPIRCQVADSRSVFVGASGFTFPCCWTYVQATSPRLYGFPPGVDLQLYDLVQRTGGFERIDARRGGLAAAVASPLFEQIESSWSCPSVAAGKPKVCARVCGADFPAYADQFQSPDLVPGGS